MASLMRFLALFTVASVYLGTASGAPPVVDKANERFAVVGYLPEWRYEGANWDVIARTVTHLLLFSLEPQADGSFGALDRLPKPALLDEARAARDKHGTELLICFGGNGRSQGFSAMVRRKTSREKFVAELVEFLRLHRLDGVDYNWEYPGYQFGRGYLADEEVARDYRGLAALVKETKTAFANARDLKGTTTLAYYPDGRQEELLVSHGLLDVSTGADFLHAMAYDASGDAAGHSPLQLCEKSIQQALAAAKSAAARHQQQLQKGGRRDSSAALDAGSFAQRLTIGLPFYGRYVESGDWRSYEDIVQKHHPLLGHVDSVKDADPPSVPRPKALAFNGVSTIRTKTQRVMESGLGGVMIWEVGQDCRLEAVSHLDGSHHVMTCPAGTNSSLLYAIASEIEKGANAPNKGNANINVMNSNTQRHEF